MHQYNLEFRILLVVRAFGRGVFDIRMMNPYPY
jgi:hypothetical protein